MLSAALLPWLAHAALGFADPEPDRRWRAAWRTGLLLALVTCGTPLAWLVAALVGVVVVVLAFTLLPGIGRDRSAWGPPVAALLVVPVLLAPWWLAPPCCTARATDCCSTAACCPLRPRTGFELGLGRFHDLGAPWWLGLVVPALAVLALIPRRTRIPVLICWVVALLAVVAAVALGGVTLGLAGLSTPPGLGFLLLLVQAALVTAVVLGALGVEHPTGLLRAGAVVVSVVAVVAPIGGLAYFVTGGGEALARDRDAGIPEYMVQSSELGSRGTGSWWSGARSPDGLTYTVRRDEGVTTGEDEVLALAGQDRGFTALVQRLASPTPASVDELASRGIEYVVLPAPATVTSARRWTRRAVSSRPARRTAAPGPGTSPSRCPPTTSTGRARGCGSCCWSSRGSAS